MKNDNTKISVIVSQFPIKLNIKENLKNILVVLSNAKPDDLIIFPEGSLSGYDEDPTFTNEINLTELSDSLKFLQDYILKRHLHIIFGTCLKENGKWYNAGIYYGTNSKNHIYRKINLATSERGYFTEGSDLSVFEIQLQDVNIKVAIQLCREIRFPEQWKYLAKKGTEIFVYLTNAIGDDKQVPIWRSHLISRAAENQRFVLGANNAQKNQKCPSMIIKPNGEVIWEVLSDLAEQKRCKINIDEISNWYLDQSREDVMFM